MRTCSLLLASGLAPLRAPEGKRNTGGIASYHHQLIQWLEGRE